MARARNIKPGFFENELLVELSFEYRLLFIGLWTIADKEGRLEDRSKKIKMQVFPADNVDVDGGLTALHDAGFIVRYGSGTDKFIQINNWKKHQSPHHTERDSVIPPLNNGEATNNTQNNLRGNPPDSLIPDSLIQEEPPIAPQWGNLNGNAVASLPENKTRQPRGKKQTFSQWVDDVRAKGEKAISEYKPVWDFAERIKLPAEFIELAWLRFKDRYTEGNNASKKYVDWRSAFRDHVENNYLKLWFWSEKDGQWMLTTAGVQADKALEVAA